MTCPSLEDLLVYATEPEAGSGVAFHVSSCDSCQSTVAEITATEGLEAELRNSLRDPDLLAPGPGPLPEIPGYRVLRELRRGGQAIVYEAVQESTRRSVAVKLLPQDAFASPRRRKRFEREVELAASLDHPSIVTVHDRGQTPQGHHYFVMKLVHGCPANEYASHSSDPQEVLELFARICDAVDYAHQRGVLHRDLKPGNILVDEEGRPQVLDFGLAKEVGHGLGSDTGLTREGEFLGTLAYASPEHVGGDPGRLDIRSDVYSLGVILYELLTGTFPYPVEGSIPSVVRSILEARPLPPGPLARENGRPPVDGDLDTIVLRCLAKEKERRYTGAAEVARDVRRHLRGEPIAARRDSRLYLLRRSIRRHRGLVAAATLAVLVVGALGYVMLHQGQRVREQEAVASHESRLKRERDHFLQIVLHSPDWDRGRVPLMTHALDQTAVRIDAEPAADWQTQAELLSWLGENYLRLYETEKAQSWFSKARALARDRSEVDPSLYGRILMGLGEAGVDLGDRNASRADLDEALGLLRGSRGPDHEDTARCVAVLSFWEYLWGDDDTAIELLESTLTVIHQDSIVRADCLNILGLIHWDRGQLESSERYLREAMRIWEASDDVLGSTDRATTMHHLGQTLMEQGRYAEALGILERVSTMMVSLWRAGAQSTIQCQALTAICRARLHGIAGAREFLDRMRSLLPFLQAEPSVTSARALSDLGHLAAMDADLEGAAELYRLSIEHYESSSSRYVRLKQQSQCAVRNRLIEVLRRLGRVAEAEEEARRNLGEAAALGDARVMARAHLVVAWLRNGQGLGREARQHAGQAVELLREHSGDPLAVAEALTCLGFIELLVLGQADAARPLLEEALATRKERLPEDDPLVADDLFLLGWLEFGKGDLDRAEPLLRRAVEIRAARLHPHDPYLAWSRNAVAALAGRRGRHEESYALAGQALDACREMQDRDLTLLSTSLFNVALSLQSLDRGEEALPILEERYELLRENRGEASPDTRQARSQWQKLLLDLEREGSAADQEQT